MTYALVHAARREADADGNRNGKIGMALIKQAALRADAISETDKIEAQVCAAVLTDTMPAAWLTAVMLVLDLSGQLASPTDAQIDTAVATAWGYFLDAKRLGG